MPIQVKTANRNRNRIINIRARQAQCELIDCATKVLGKSRSDFMLEAACREAEAVLIGRTFFALDEAKFQEFMELLDAPPNANGHLHKLLRTKAPWD